MDMDVYGRGQEEMSQTLSEVRDFLKSSLTREASFYFGINDEKWLESVTNNWFDDQNNYDGRWKIIN